LSGKVGEINMNEGFLLGASIMMEIPFIMILLSRLLNNNINRWFNIVAACIMTLVQVSSLFVGSKLTLHYRFFSIIEIGVTLFIFWYAWNWKTKLENK
jgi:hypothetical protein